MVPGKLFTDKKMSYKQAWHSLYHELVDGWSNRHERFCEQIIKGQTFYEDIWEREQETYSTKSLRS